MINICKSICVFCNKEFTSVDLDIMESHITNKWGKYLHCKEEKKDYNKNKLKEETHRKKLQLIEAETELVLKKIELARSEKNKGN